MIFPLVIVMNLIHILVKCQELEIIGKNSMLYDPVNNLPYPCDSETKPSRRNFEDSPKDSDLWSKSSLKTMNKKMSSVSNSSKLSNGNNVYQNKITRTLYKRGDGDAIPIKLPPCPFPNGTQEHRWLKTLRKRTFARLKWPKTLKDPRS